MLTKETDMKGLIFNIQGYSIHDGPGLRTTVFMKKCPLRCKWCSNPESMNNFPEIFHIKEKCVKCYHCMDICPYGAISVPKEGEFISINRGACADCKESPCVKECYQRALEIVGRYITAEELLNEVEKDALFYRNSGGGVTLSGGEPTSQHEFALQFLKGCKDKYIHTTLDTTGYAHWETLRELLDYTDLVLYDIKHMNSSLHKELTGVYNEQILENLEAILDLAKVPVVVRIPLIPGQNNSKENMEATARFLKKVGAKEVNLMPYHRLGMGKYKQLGRTYPLEKDILPPDNAEMENIKRIYESYDLCCSIGG